MSDPTNIYDGTTDEFRAEIDRVGRAAWRQRTPFIKDFMAIGFSGGFTLLPGTMQVSRISQGVEFTYRTENPVKGFWVDGAPRIEAEQPFQTLRLSDAHPDEIQAFDDRNRLLGNLAIPEYIAYEVRVVFGSEAYFAFMDRLPLEETEFIPFIPNTATISDDV